MKAASRVDAEEQDEEQAGEERGSEKPMKAKVVVIWSKSE